MNPFDPEKPADVQRPWTDEEHKRFIEALETYGNGSTGNEWQMMAGYVGSRSFNEIKLHAHKYFLKLQSVCSQPKTMRTSVADALKDPQKSKSGRIVNPKPEDLDSGQWTAAEEIVFESALAVYPEGAPKRWEKVANMLAASDATRNSSNPKSANDVRIRYQKLLYDIARIESGDTVRPKKNTTVLLPKKTREKVKQYDGAACICVRCA